MTELQTGGRQAEAAATYKIASIPADGVGKEVIAAGRKVLDFVAEQSNGKFAFQWDDFDWGSEYYARTGRMMAEDGLETLKDYDAIYFGAVGWANVPDHISLWGLRLNITQNFDQWANIRPVKFHPGIQSPLRKADDTELDWVVVRENSEGEYAGLGGRNLSGRGPGNEVALQTALFTEKGCERILRFAFDLARTRTVKKVSCVTKSNAQQYGMVLWDETFKRVAKDYPDVATESVLVDAMSAKFILHPEDLSVVVASNLNADILSDLGSALAGSLGLAGQREPQPGAPVPVDVRAGARVGPGHRRPGHQQPDRHHRLRRPDAGSLRPARRGPRGRGRDRRHHRRRARDPRRGRHREHRAGHRRDHRGPQDRAGPRLTAAGAAHAGPVSTTGTCRRRFHAGTTRHRPESQSWNISTSIDPGRVLWVF